jgi:phospholipid N-methyltransferase
MLWKEFIQDPGKTGAIAQSSPRLARYIAQKAHLSDKRAVVEFGPGTSVVTREILRHLRPGATFFALETNPRLVDLTRRNCPGATVYRASAEEIGHHLQLHGRDSCDCIISSLPWANFSRGLQDRILEASHQALQPGGLLLSFSYWQSRVLPGGQYFRQRLSHYFDHVERSRTVWRNLPPAFLYQAYK